LKLYLQTTKPLTMNALSIILLFYFTNPVNPEIDFATAVNTGKIKVEITSNGNGLADGMLTAKIKNVTNSPLNVNIPAGQIFICEEDPRQNLIIVKEEVFALSPNKDYTKSLVGMCIEADDMSPGNDVTYKVGKKAADNLMKCAEFISKNKLYNSTGQNAIWVFSDNHEIGWIDASTPAEIELREYAAKLKGVENPWYSTSRLGNQNHQLSDTYDPNQPRTEVYEMTEAEINGNFEWSLDKRTNITFAIYNSEGKAIRTFFSDKQFPHGELSLRFHYKATHMERGTYFARMTNGDNVISQREFTF